MNEEPAGWRSDRPAAGVLVRVWAGQPLRGGPPHDSHCLPWFLASVRVSVPKSPDATGADQQPLGWAWVGSLRWPLLSRFRRLGIELLLFLRSSSLFRPSLPSLTCIRSLEVVLQNSYSAPHLARSRTLSPSSPSQRDSLSTTFTSSLNTRHHAILPTHSLSLCAGRPRERRHVI